jgi:chemotaxis protein methyltransferase CheR
VASSDWSGLLQEVERRRGEGGESSLLLQYQAKALANLGDLAGARRCCEQSIQIDPMDKHSYLLLSLILLESDDAAGAEAALRKVIYLDIKMAEAHYHLALLHLRKGNRAMGFKGLEQALAIAEAKPADEPVHDAQGMTHQRFGQIIRQELAVFRRSTAAGEPASHPRRLAARFMG